MVYNYFSVGETKNVGLWQKINNIVRFAFLSVQIFFSKTKNFLEINKHSANCFKISTVFFVEWGTSTYYWQKIFSVVEKIRFHASAGFCHRKLSLFWWMIVFKKFFQTLGGCFLDFGKKTSTDCQNCIFICPEKHLQEKKISWKKTNSFIKFQTSSGVVFEKNLVKEKIFWQKNISTVVKTGLYASRGTFWGKYVSRKKVNCFCTLSGILLSCVALVWHVYQKRFIVYRWRFWEKSFFWTKKFLRNFFRTYEENCRTLAMKLLSIIKSAFH